MNKRSKYVKKRWVVCSSKTDVGEYTANQGNEYPTLIRRPFDGVRVTRPLIGAPNTKFVTINQGVDNVLDREYITNVTIDRVYKVALDSMVISYYDEYTDIPEGSEDERLYIFKRQAEEFAELVSFGVNMDVWINDQALEPLVYTPNGVHTFTIYGKFRTYYRVQDDRPINSLRYAASNTLSVQCTQFHGGQVNDNINKIRVKISFNGIVGDLRTSNNNILRDNRIRFEEYLKHIEYTTRFILYIQ